MTDQTKQQATHHGITCDECGTHPILGVRYKAKYVYDYDICESCWQTHEPDNESFVAFETEESDTVTNRVCEVEDDRLYAWSVVEAARKLREHDHAHVACLNLCVTFSGSELLRDALSADTRLEIIYIHMACVGGHPRLGGEIKNAIVNIAKGIETNRSIKRVFFHIRQDARGDESVSLALRNMLANNRTMEACFIERSCRGDYTQENTTDPGANHFALQVFRGLRENKCIKNFRLCSYNVLSEDTKCSILEAVQHNDIVEKVATADFEPSDYRLELILACRRGKWMERLVDTRASKRDRLIILQEALEAMSAAPVAASYHLLRACPEIMK